MKYIIMLYASQRDYDKMTGKPTEGPAWDPEQVAAMHEFMGRWNNELVESGEFVAGVGLAAPVHTRRLGTRDGKPFVTDGPYAETQEVLAGYTIVDCESFDRATEIAARLSDCPPVGDGDEYVDIRPIDGPSNDLEL